MRQANQASQVGKDDHPEWGAYFTDNNGHLSVCVSISVECRLVSNVVVY